MRGQSYKGLKKNDEGKFHFSECKSARKIRPRCNSTFCIKNSKSRKCPFIKEEDREKLFKTFWNDMSWSERRTYVSTLCTIQPTKVNTIGNNDSRRKGTIKYFLKIENEVLPVCKKMFLQTLDLKEWSVRNWISNSCNGSGITISPDHQKNISKVGRKPNKNKGMIKFFDNLPKLPSHYCRSNTNKLYLESFFESKVSVFKAYVASLQGDETAVSKTEFYSEFQKRNLALYSPKKDLCDLCEGFKYGNITQDVYDVHQKKKMDARDAKNLEKQLAINNPNEHVSLTMDVQAVKLAPFIRASSMYYKTKLCVHNYTIFNQSTADVCCYLWDETNGGLESSIFATLIIDYLNNIIEKTPTISKISLFSDGCGYQNRNIVVSNALLKFSIDHKVTITQNFLEKGHTQMEVDSVHHTIEMRLRKREIHLPTDYINVCRDARIKTPYRVKYLNFSCFNDYTSLKY